MQFGGPFPYTGSLATRENLAITVRHIEDLGFDYVWMGDHVLFPKRMKSPYPYTADGALPISPTHNFLEIFTTYAYVAALTQTLRLHTNILIPALRSPFLAARQAATLDYLSGGRLNLGLGLGWMEDEYEAVGASWKARGKLLDEWMDAFRALQAERAFSGEHFQFGESHFHPKPVQNPLPLWIGGDSDAAIRRAATRGNGWQPVGPYPMAERCRWLREKIGVIAELRAGKNLDMQNFGLLSFVGYLGTAAGGNTLAAWKQRIVDDIGALADVGITHVTVMFNELNSTEPLQKTLDEAQWFAEEIIYPSARAC